MILSDKRLLGGVAAAVLVAAAGGFTVARWTADTPAAPAPEGGKSEAAEAEAAPSDTLPMSAEMMKRTGVTTETVNPGGLAAEIVAQATVAPSPTGEAIVTARAGGAVTRVFKRLGDAVRRGEALAAGSLVEHKEGSGQIVIFISHTWWDRDFKDETNDASDVYDKGSPDWQSGEKKNLKWRVICAGVQRLLEQEGLKEEEVSLWVDWQSIYQDDEAEKLKGVMSLIRYATLCQYMLVPTEEAELVDVAAILPAWIPAYGSRGWW